MNASDGGSLRSSLSACVCFLRPPAESMEENRVQTGEAMKEISGVGQGVGNPVELSASAEAPLSL